MFLVRSKLFVPLYRVAITSGFSTTAASTQTAQTNADSDNGTGKDFFYNKPAVSWIKPARTGRDLVKKTIKQQQENKNVHPNHYRYNPWQALKLMRAHTYCAFQQTVDICIQLNVNPRNGEHLVRGSAVMPSGTGKKIVVALLCQPEYAEQALEAGVDILIDDSHIEQIKQNKINFDKLYTTPELLPLLKAHAKVLGPKGLMPNAKMGTLIVRDKIKEAILQAKAGEVSFRVDAGRNIHAPLGKVSFTDEQIIRNLESLMKTLVQKRPVSLKGKFLVDAFIKSTMGPRFGINIDTLDPKSRNYLLNLTD